MKNTWWPSFDRMINGSPQCDLGSVNRNSVKEEDCDCSRVLCSFLVFYFMGTRK